ncbi:MAG TPA: PAS domain S-box protein [Pseudolabrys sp.]|nr:PAS domain S-box protein [Pseudolabrys sp.]
MLLKLEAQERRSYDMSIQTNNELAEDRSSLPESILEQIADAVIYADRSGTIRRWNQAAASLFGYSATEALGQNLDLIIPEHLRAHHWRGFEAAMANGVVRLQGRPTLTRATHKTGSKLYVEMTFALVNGDFEGPVIGAVAVARDATERVEQERAVVRQDSPR